jgi:two-component system NtrC family response regulator/two-component system response regulator HydG
MTTQIKILFVDDEKNIQVRFQSAMKKNKTVVTKTASSGKEALEKLERFSADIVITDIRMPHMDGYALLMQIKKRYPQIFVVVISAYSSIENAVKAMKMGAYDYIPKPFDFDIVNLLIDKIAGHKRAIQPGIPHSEQRSHKKHRFENIIGRDQKMFNIYETIAQVAPSKASVLITGESGTGKELVAEAIHFRSLRRNKPFIRVNCAAFSESLITSELFGHEKGAFTGAHKDKKGYFELADGGTIFLDEIGDIPMQTQISLLRVLDMGTFQRVGGNRTLKIDTRVICATNQDLSQVIREKLFRQDLFYRINVVAIHVPPLRDRKNDIQLLANYFLEKQRKATNKPVARVSMGAFKVFTKYDWPGNVRELANAIERAVILCNGREIKPEHLPEEIKSYQKDNKFVLQLPSKSLPLAEKTLIRKALLENNWNLKQAAQELEIARGTLYSKMSKYGIEKPD